jgi:hypothetical protein
MPDLQVRFRHLFPASHRYRHPGLFVVSLAQFTIRGADPLYSEICTVQIWSDDDQPSKPPRLFHNALELNDFEVGQYLGNILKTGFHGNRKSLYGYIEAGTILCVA